MTEIWELGLAGNNERVNVIFTKFPVDLDRYCGISRGYSPLGNNGSKKPAVVGSFVYHRSYEVDWRMDNLHSQTLPNTAKAASAAGQGLDE